MTPANKALVLLSRLGWEGDHCEYKRGKFSQDWCGWADILAFRGRWLIGIQATSYKNVSTRVKKLRENDSLLRWLQAGHQAEVWGFKQEDDPERLELSLARTLTYAGGLVVSSSSFVLKSEESENAR